MKLLIKIISIVLLMINSVYAHEEEKASKLPYQTFKQRIHELCSGHGLMHLKPLEIKKIANFFPEYLKDITSLQQSAKSDNFLCQLTALIIRSNLSKEEKQKLLNKSYQISLDKDLEGEEWPFTITILIEETKILDAEKINRHTDSTNEYLKYISKQYLQKLQNNKPIKKSDKKKDNKATEEKQSATKTIKPELIEDPKSTPQKATPSEKEKSSPIKAPQISKESSKMNDDALESYILYIIAGTLLTGTLFLFLKTSKGSHN